MIDANKLWKHRNTQYITEIRRYLKYMFNDHLLIALIFLIGGAAFVYSGWLETLSPTFPAILIIAILLAIPLTNSQIQTLLKEPDIVFLLQVENKLTPYFQKAFLSSLVFQSYLIVLLLAAISPLYFKVTGNSFLALFVIFCVLILQKIWNLLITWNVNYFIEPWARTTDRFVRFFINFLFVYLLLKEANFLFIVGMIAIMIVLLLYFNRATSSKSLNWNQLIDLESRRMMTFYRIANLFTDVPKLKERVKRRRWLDWVTGMLPYAQKNTYGHLYLRTFLRSSDYLGMYVRLLVIGGLILYFIPLGNGKILVALLFIYLTGYQLMTLWRQHSLKIWIDLYPVSKDTRLSSFLQLILVLLAVQSLLFAVSVFVSGMVSQSLLVLVLSIIFTYLFVQMYIKGKIKKLS
ncbi:ABC transporter permease [Bacillus luteolus]|uniref:ABC transporter permease n=1 Tax=Litchfieldia luteola TaxID=682179 RepID=A0ABR9QE22_9BACI|nr:ABC transporter permease [Cytobacillus luteolus]MBE4906742.1 ABC transporter permease [Cytobacillus luteolus]MBP1940607.1 ABC-2 type transport system permease protein [Cytobacillus luteolus]